MKIAIYGCGQLAQMMAQAAHSLNIATCFLAEPSEETTCVEGLGDIVPIDRSDLSATLARCGELTALTVEREQVDLQVLQHWDSSVPIYPPIAAIEIAQHRLREKSMLDQLEIPTAPWARSDAGRATFADRLGLPLVVKHPTDGYDGKSQWRVKTFAELDELLNAHPGETLLIENKIDFDFEASIIAARDANGQLMCYPITCNEHSAGILISSVAPSRKITPEISRTLQDYATRMLDHLDYVGVLTIECFVQSDKVLVNEIAPRVHNSGHWTRQPGLCSQFEQHIRAICGLPLVSFEPEGYFGIVNLLGPLDSNAPLQVDGAASYWYGKASRAGRKLGHITLRADTEDDIVQRQLACLSELEAQRNSAL